MKFYRQWQPIKALTFDLDDTFYDNHPFIRLAEQRKFEFMHREYPETQQISKLQWQKWRADVVAQFPQYKGDMIRLRRTVLTKALAEVGLQGDALHDAVERVYQTFYFERSNFRVRDEIIEILATLSQHYPLVAITNGNVDLTRIGIAPFFQLALHADHQQPMKPNPCMFNKAADFLGLPATEILHVGDNLEKDVMGAINAGFKAGWYADNRHMNLTAEKAKVLPDVEFATLHELVTLVC